MQLFKLLVKFLLICQIWMLLRRTPDPKGSRDPNGVVLVSLLLTLNIFHTLFLLLTHSVSIVNFEQVIAKWDRVRCFEKAQTSQKQLRGCSVNKTLCQTFAKLTGKHLCQWQFEKVRNYCNLTKKILKI